MAKRLSVKEMLEAARKGGPAKPAEPDASSTPAETPDTPAVEPTAPAADEPVAAASEPAPAANVPTPTSLGRPLTLKEKLAAARAGGAAPPAGAPAAKPPAAAAAEEAPEPAAASASEEAPAEAGPAAPAVPAPAPSLGRPLTLKEKLAAARAGGSSAAPAAGAKPAASKPAAAAGTAAAAKSAAPRTLPPLDKITDPKDLAEALRQSGAKKAKESAALAAAKAAEAGGATPAQAATAAKAAGQKETKPQSVLPKPSKAAAGVATAATTRRRFVVGPVAWIVLGWASFVSGLTLFSAMLGRFMFPNVLAEPPSTVKVGLPSNFEPEEVNERFKAEWGFWIVRSTRYNGEDIVYALQSVCTHLGCPPNWLGGEQKFKCPCHGSGFYISGVNFEGPAPRPLERFKVTLADDGQMVVDKSQKFQQELGQWSEPESYISA